MGPTSLRWHEARQLVSLPILELVRSRTVRVGSHGGAARRLHEQVKKQNKGLTEEKEGDDESAISPSLVHVKGQNYKAPLLNDTLSLFRLLTSLKNGTYLAVKTALNV